MIVHKDQIVFTEQGILTEIERLKLLKFVKTIVTDLGEKYPGLQTRNGFHTYTETENLLNNIKKFHNNYKIIRCWANFSKGDFISWHNHTTSNIAIVYFLQNKCNMGPMFKTKDKIEVTKCKENSLLIFPSYLIHSSPVHLPEDRYSIAFELIKI
jgi:hypothetical protein|tara:strand:- start:102 stop:566 length:465 start_codon:yes stop_codon:yes gene_type:complete